MGTEFLLDEIYLYNVHTGFKLPLTPASARFLITLKQQLRNLSEDRSGVTQGSLPWE